MTGVDWARLLDSLDDPPLGTVGEALVDATDTSVSAACDRVEATLEAGDPSGYAIVPSENLSSRYAEYVGLGGQDGLADGLGQILYPRPVTEPVFEAAFT